MSGAMACPVCASTDVVVVRDRVKGNKPCLVYRCAACDLDFLETWKDREWASEFYAQDEYVFQPNLVRPEVKFDEYALRLARMKPHLTPSSRLLEVGAGDGRMLELLKPHVGVAHATELTPSHVASLRARGFHVFDQFLEDIVPDTQYDVISMFALLEHVPDVGGFLDKVKSLLAPGGSVFIEVPDLMDPLARVYDVPAYRDFYYREYHLYYFTKRSLERLLARHGFATECTHLMQASLTNHLHWMHTGKGQPNTNAMVNVTLPVDVLAPVMPDGRPLMDVLDRLDTEYRNTLTAAGIGDLLACRAWVK